MCRKPRVPLLRNNALVMGVGARKTREPSHLFNLIAVFNEKSVSSSLALMKDAEGVSKGDIR